MMIALAIIVGLWVPALAVLLLSRDIELDVNRALSSDEQIVSTPELIPASPAAWSTLDEARMDWERTAPAAEATSAA